eukprot:gnl/MRDRNA2_/MRDRNA2_80192_c0_seq2.p1 gnl/MRDRNA2_/MRDRNA2_80192_c0~~gnl/MRDRNA2_/MRDRNA2_80192_c0_seq2.p1  ORF type:complete len:612 (+),score=94.56 gnl/MRDRNA2_/MRDRNA2_80192_c0_seq2:79-1914(+)
MFTMLGISMLLALGFMVFVSSAQKDTSSEQDSSDEELDNPVEATEINRAIDAQFRDSKAAKEQNKKERLEKTSEKRAEIGAQRAARQKDLQRSRKSEEQTAMQVIQEDSLRREATTTKSPVGVVQPTTKGPVGVAATTPEFVVPNEFDAKGLEDINLTKYANFGKKADPETYVIHWPTAFDENDIRWKYRMKNVSDGQIRACNIGVINLLNTSKYPGYKSEVFFHLMEVETHRRSGPTDYFEPERGQRITSYKLWYDPQIAIDQDHIPTFSRFSATPPTEVIPFVHGSYFAIHKKGTPTVIIDPTSTQEVIYVMRGHIRDFTVNLEGIHEIPVERQLVFTPAPPVDEAAERDKELEWFATWSREWPPLTWNKTEFREKHMDLGEVPYEFYFPGEDPNDPVTFAEDEAKARSKGKGKQHDAMGPGSDDDVLDKDWKPRLGEDGAVGASYIDHQAAEERQQKARYGKVIGYDDSGPIREIVGGVPYEVPKGQPGIPRMKKLDNLDDRYDMLVGQEQRTRMEDPEYLEALETARQIKEAYEEDPRKGKPSRQPMSDIPDDDDRMPSRPPKLSSVDFHYPALGIWVCAVFSMGVSACFLLKLVKRQKQGCVPLLR